MDQNIEATMLNEIKQLKFLIDGIQKITVTGSFDIKHLENAQFYIESALRDSREALCILRGE
jgi:hypothetical protein